MAISLFDENYAKALSDYFLDAMYQKRYSKEELADRLGIKYNTLYRYLNCSRQMPIDIFNDICAILDLDFVESFKKVNQIAVDRTISQVSSR